MSPPDQAHVDSGRLSLVQERAAVEHAERTILDALARHGYPKASLFAVRLSLEEAISNAFHHGHAGLPPDLPISLEFDVAHDRVTISVQDQGPGFDPAAVPDPTLDENLENPTGRGLMLIRAYMSDVRFNPRGNRLTMTYFRPRATG